MTHDVTSRLERGNPYPVPPEVRDTEWAGELLASIVSDEMPPSAPAPRRRPLGRRGLVVVLAATLLIGGGAALAAIAINREAPAPTQASVRQALSLAGSERDALRPLPGGIREAFRAETPYGTWVIDTIQTRARGILIADGVLKADGSLQGGNGIGSCGPEVLHRSPGIAWRNPVIGWCESGSSSLPNRPKMEFIGRVSHQVAAVELRLPDGRVVPGHLDRGFFLVLLDRKPPAGDLHLVAKNAYGSTLVDQTLRAPRGAVVPFPVGP